MTPAENKAVFLSYASQDADAARRICEALRAAGIEVWFDQSELRGGDAWDAKIRKQIKECALFVPVISANTQARLEGYFRLEWKLAAQRTHTMAEAKPFLVPVCIDGTRDAEAHVPEEFRAVQWTRLAKGEAGAAFCARVKNLAGEAAPVSRAPAEPPTHLTADGRGSRRVPLGLAIVVAVGSAAVAAFFWVPNKPQPVSAPTAHTAAAPITTKTTAAPRLGPKSIAVLPFENQSADKDADAFFADGIHEDLITNLLVVRELRCVPRATAMSYRDTKKSHREIAEELGVAHVLTGSVRRADKRVRITCTLVDARNDTPLWTKPYDKDLTDAGVIFAIQSELSQTIAAELKAALSPEEKQLIAKPPTRNVAAYELVLKARSLANQPDGPRVHRGKIIPLLEEAVTLDPSYVAAYADLVYACVYLGGQRDVAKAKAAIDAALRVDPDSPDITRALGDYYYYGLDDFARALEHYSKAIALRPNDAGCLHRLGSVQRRQGRWMDAVGSFRKVKELDPTNLNSVGGLGNTLLSGRRYDDALAEFRYNAERLPRENSLLYRFEVAKTAFLATGSMHETEELWRQLPPAELNSTSGMSYRLEWALCCGDVDEAVRLDRELGGRGVPRIRSTVGIDIAAALMARGETNAARARLQEMEASFRQSIETAPTRAPQWAWLGSVLALLGQKDEALVCARKGVELMPEARDAIIGAILRAQLAFTYSWTGEKDQAIAEYAALIRKPWSYMIFPTAENNVHVMKRHPRYHPLRGDPRFEALLNDPKNNAPLF